MVILVAASTVIVFALAVLTYVHGWRGLGVGLVILVAAELATYWARRRHDRR